MTALSKNNITFEKPYLYRLSQSIKNGDLVSFTDKTSEKIIKTQSVRTFLNAVKNHNKTEVLKVLRSGKEYNEVFNGRRWIDIEKNQYSKKQASDAKTTKMQELASLYAIQSSIESNGYSSFYDFITKLRPALIKIYPDINENWERAIYQQQLKVQKEVGNTQFNHYSRDDGFMEFITGLVRKQYKISQKDTWNPADIWLVSEYGKIKNTLNKIIKDNETSLQEFNAILAGMFHNREIIGISLKYISGSTAQWEAVNLENSDVFDNDKYQFSYDSAFASFKLKSPSSKELENIDSKILISGKGTTIKLQLIRASNAFSNISIQGTDLSAPGARLGAAPIEMVSKLFISANLNGRRWRSYKNYPQSLEEYDKEKSIHERRFATLMRNRGVDLGVSQVKKFSENIRTVFEAGDPSAANTKLNQLDLLNEVFRLSGQKLDYFLTSLCYLAQKKGKVFGPFAKIY